MHTNSVMYIIWWRRGRVIDQCNEPKTIDTGHSCQSGFIFCPKNQLAQTKEQWLEELRPILQAKKAKKAKAAASKATESIQ